MNPSVLRCSQEFLFVLSSPLGLAEITVPIVPAPLPADKPSLSRALPPSPEGQQRAAGGFDSGHVSSFGAAEGAGMQPASICDMGLEARRSHGLCC